MDLTPAQEPAAARNTPAARQDSPDPVLTGFTVTGLIGLLPTVVVSWLLVLSTDRGTSCLMYGEQCSPVPGWALYDAFALALVAGMAALVWPRGRRTGGRGFTVLVQWGAQCALAGMILSGA
ncbi:hypothetical protein [Streptomyces sp. NPDC005435]|uniref:hypothetical protein n=1 Tax=Streptomyces sp. NPDC005435 TaxID=3154464 RepID=UPI003457186D